MRRKLLLFAVPLLFAPLARGQDSAVSSTEKLKDSIREWIETNREIQKQDNDWEQDREVLEAHREGLRSEIVDLKEQIEQAKSTRGEADKKSLKAVETYDKFKVANELVSARLGDLEKAMLERLPLLPPVLLEEPRIAQMVSDLKASVAKGEKGDQQGNSRLNTVLNLMAAAEQFQGQIHLNHEPRKLADGRKLNIRMVYFGLAAAYGVDEEGMVAFVGKPGSGGWVFEEKNDLAPQIKRLVDVMNGDEAAQFVSLPIDLP